MKTISLWLASLFLLFSSLAFAEMGHKGCPAMGDSGRPADSGAMHDKNTEMMEMHHPGTGEPDVMKNKHMIPDTEKSGFYSEENRIIDDYL